MSTPTFVMPNKPELMYGVWDQHRQLVVPQPVRPDRAHYVGWKVNNHYGLGNSLVMTSKEEAQAPLQDSLNRWERLVLERQRYALDMTHVFEGRTFQSAYASGSYGSVTFYINGLMAVTIERTRYGAVSGPAVEGPIDQPFTVRKVLSNGRAFRLEGGGSITFPRKMELSQGSVPNKILAEIYATD
jgi:hypothetical protein